jgi:hypothetical protein
MELLGTIITTDKSIKYSEDYFISILNPLRKHIDWSTHGTFSNAGGHKGAKEVHSILVKAIK